MGLLRILPVVLLTSLIAFGPSVMSAATHSASTHSAAAPMLAEVSNASPPVADWQGIFGTMSVTGVLAWYLYYTTSVANPKTRQEFRDELAAQRKHDEEASAKRDDQVDRLCARLDRLYEKMTEGV
jgi:hypothetical protein